MSDTYHLGGVALVDVTVETTIDRPVSVVAKYAADPTNAVHWWANVSAAAWQGTAGAAVGSKFAFTASHGGRPVECLYEISEFTPGERLVIRTEQGPFPMETTYAWAATDSGTRMTVRRRGSPGGLGRLLEPLKARGVEAGARDDLSALKGILEGRPVS
ncbi:MAG TPA: SRPBCC family protein [Sporichthyaceae bacterium]|jgi:uncharacterized protein YndB with AHSA1/START domain|nr:SRPBCC family protein [Sporichthyaceae bacterium]